MLSNNPFILLSYINTKLRDFYQSIDLLCEDLDYDREEIFERLLTINYVYDEELNQFICKED